MRGLAFPPNVAADREPSYEYGTPISNVDDIPIDPALSGAAIDPALMMGDESTSVAQPDTAQQLEQYIPYQPPLLDEYQIRQYSQGPQGDPFAPQIPAPFFPIEQEEPRPPPKPKRKRKVHREDDCSFCQGDERKNMRGEAEPMLTCHECGRSGHPSCMELEKLGDVVRSYPWKCIECKNCEMCQEKGDDERILFCDCCDRGWHMDCMEPPIQTPPDGEWRCPLCPPIMPEEEEEYPEGEDVQKSSAASAREGSVASTSRSAADVPQPVSKGRRSKKVTGKGRKRGVPKIAVVSDGSDNDDPVEVVDSTVVGRNRGRLSKPSAKAKAHAGTVSSDDERQARPSRGPKRKRPREPSPPASAVTRVRLRITAPRGKGKEREEDDTPHGMFDDILGVQERDISKTTPTNADKLHFERSRMLAEEKLAVPLRPPPPTALSSRAADHSDSHLHSRPLRSAALQQLSLSTTTPKGFDFSNSPGPSTPGGSLPKFEPGVLRIRTIRFGPYDIKTWYDAPFPEEYASIPDGRLWICEFCLKYMKSRFKAIRHQMKCKTRHPPGDEIYRDGPISIFEVDGRRNKIYCQNLCLLSKMFLDHKSLFYDVEPFLFYVITQVDDFGARFVGYFSKEKRCPKDYNLSCIMTLPVRQRQGWGNLLIDFSYLLSKIEQRTGSPEKPLSSLGALGYKNYWTLALMRFLEKAPDNVRLEDISSATSMTLEDVCNALIQQNMLDMFDSSPTFIRPSPGQTIKFPKGRKNGVARKQLQKLLAQDKDPDGNKGPFVPPKHYEIRIDRQKVETYLRNWEAKGQLKLKPDKLQWTPYLVTRTPQDAVVPKDSSSLTENVAGELAPRNYFLNGRLPEPITPGPANGMLVDSPQVESPLAQDEEDKDDLPMLVDTPEPRTRTRSSARSPIKPPEPIKVRRTSRSLKTPVAISSPPPTPPPPRSLRTRSSHGNVPSPSLFSVEGSSSIRTPRKIERRRSSRKADIAEDDDEALAAKLALEEQMQGRQLRSGRGESKTSENKRPAPPVKATPKSHMRNKRRRIDSSPEIEDSPAPAPLSPLPEIPAPVEDDEPDARVNGERESPMLVDHISAKVNGKVNGHSEQILCTPDATDATTPGDDAAARDASAEDVIAEVMGSEEADVKSEDRGTPLTSRQSVPSDDTVFLTDTVHGAVINTDANKFAEYQGAVHAESDLRSTLEKHGVMDLDECHDEDADGEYELDAEGEEDAEYAV